LAGYVSFANILPEFSEANLLPPGFDPQRLDEGSGILATISCHHVKWHKNCRLFFYKTQLERASKRNCESDLAELGTDLNSCAEFGD